MPETVVVNGIEYWTMGDAAFVANLDGTSFGIGSGYYGGPRAFHVWSARDWQNFPGYRLPNWVGGTNGASEGATALKALKDLGVPEGAYTALDMETRVDKQYVRSFASVVHPTYRVMVYGSASTVFGNPNINGYWVADYAGIGPFMYDHPDTRMTQYASNAKYDSSLVKKWIVDDRLLWHG